MRIALRAALIGAALLSLASCAHADKMGAVKEGTVIGERHIDICDRLTIMDRYGRIGYVCVDERDPRQRTYEIGDQYP